MPTCFGLTRTRRSPEPVTVPRNHLRRYLPAIDRVCLWKATALARGWRLGVADGWHAAGNRRWRRVVPLGGIALGNCRGIRRPDDRHGCGRGPQAAVVGRTMSEMSEDRANRAPEHPAGAAEEQKKHDVEQQTSSPPPARDVDTALLDPFAPPSLPARYPAFPGRDDARLAAGDIDHLLLRFTER
jgi:hypothetical protein